MKKYYQKAIDLGNEQAMNTLGYYYQNVEKYYSQMKNIIIWQLI
jgi:TPR repeat protein